MKKQTIIILNIILFILLAFTWFLAFDLEWGLNANALTWGLPVLLILAGLIVSIVLMIRKKKIRYGQYGLGASITVILYMVLLLHFFSSVLLPKHMIPQEQMSEEDRILSMILETRFGDDEYMVVAPETIRPEASAVDMSPLKTKMLAQGYDAENLTRKLYAVNQKPSRLNINSSIHNGYYIDYDDQFSRYISDSGGGWLRWVLFHPQVSGYTHISSPAYDPESGYVLIYFQVRFNSTHYSHEYGIEAYRYKDGTLEYIGISKALKT